MSDETVLLETITRLSHLFGSDDFVKGGGGNTSCKDDKTLWVKPSGTTLGGMNPETFLAMDRAKLAELFTATPPEETQARERFVAEMMSASLCPGSEGRASVEAPLHTSFDATYVVHTHPALVNGMTCAQNGAAICAQLFPEAMWFPYTDPGYTLCMAVRKALDAWDAEKGAAAQIVFLQNHGVFIAADTAEEVEKHYNHIMDTLRHAYGDAGIKMELTLSDAPATDAQATTQAAIRDALGEDGAYVTVGLTFAVATGPISPDHIVYHKTCPFTGAISKDAVEAFKKEKGYAPRLFVTDAGVYGAGASQKVADLALLLAQDGALIAQLAQAFGGIHYLDDAARLFIENWEAESYRQKVSSK